MTISASGSRMRYICLSVAILSMHVPLGNSATQAAEVANRLVDSSLYPGQSNWVDGFVLLCRDASIPCGLEMISGWNVETKINKSFSKVPVATILNLLVSEHPEYQWILDDGIINIAPRETLGNKISRIRAGLPAESPLDRKIEKLDIVDTYPQDAVSNVICPAAKLQCPAPLLTPGGTPYAEPPRKVSLHLKNVTVRKALNALVRRDGHSMWHFWYGDDKTIEIYIYTFSVSKGPVRK